MLAKFMSSTLGRRIRFITGLVMIAVGLLVMRDSGGVVLAVLGFVPLFAGIFDVCMIAPLCGIPVKGDAARKL